MCIIEIGDNFTRDETEILLSRQEIRILESDEKSIKGNFIKSNMYIFCEFFPDPQDFAAEVENKYNNRIKTKIVLFYLMQKYDQCCLETRKLINDIMSIKNVFFVFSFDYSNVYAVNDRDGFRILGDGHMILDDPA